ncbi:MAG: hypothetical protein AAF391_11790 [Bacteroidota bacterium]
MKNLGFFYVLLLLSVSACQENIDTVTDTTILTQTEVVEMELTGRVEPHYLQQKFTPVQDVTVSLVHNDVVIDEVNTNGFGTYYFESQPIPVEGAYVVIEAPGFFPNIRKIVPSEPYYRDHY